ncbi:probable choline kinase 2 [Oryza brachyantha]|uniref:probable choline kinase 2 n=1 Tax=Oryza brachyantha TaxID=4533 RepID=UPI001ADBA678|nr:probable choline kinase 2 [Oryza brachyantha]
MPPVAIYLYIHIFILLVHRCLSAAAYAPASPPSASPPAQPVRVYREGVEVFFDRETEVRTFECMSRHGHGPRLLGRFPNGRVEEFIHTRSMCQSLCQMEVLSKVEVRFSPRPSRMPVVWSHHRQAED